MMTPELRERIKKQLTLHEGLERKPYRDSVGFWTIGIGRNLDANPLSDDEIDVIFENDLQRAVKEAEKYPWFLGLSINRQLVILDMLFNLGPSRFAKFQKMIKALEDQDYAEAELQMRTSKWYKQVKSRGVTLCSMMLEG